VPLLAVRPQNKNRGAVARPTPFRPAWWAAWARRATRGCDRRPGRLSPMN